jgi:hypothetical protein
MLCFGKFTVLEDKVCLHKAVAIKEYQVICFRGFNCFVDNPRFSASIIFLPNMSRTLASLRQLKAPSVFMQETDFIWSRIQVDPSE